MNQDLIDALYLLGEKDVVILRLQNNINELSAKLEKANKEKDEVIA